MSAEKRIYSPTGTLKEFGAIAFCVYCAKEDILHASAYVCVCVRACCACALVGGCVRATRNVFRYVYVRYAYIEVVTLFVMTNNIRIFTGQLNINIFYYLNPGVHTWAVLCVALGFIMDVHM